MPRKTKPSSTTERRVYTDDFKRDAVAMLLDGHSGSSIAQRIAFYAEFRHEMAWFFF